MDYMKQIETILVQKCSEKFICDLCDYSTCRNSQYIRHLSTGKHKNRTNETFETEMKHDSSEKFQCTCGILFNSRTTLWRHKKTCNQNNDKQTNSISDKELIMALVKQNADLMDILKNNSGQINNNTNSLNNSNNKIFNLNLFLNETCKNAMNIMEFVDSIKLQINDLEKVGEVGYIEGISNIITSNLKMMDYTLRPVHCTDKKRKVVYVKDENNWEKEDDKNTKMRKMINRVANKNIRLLPLFREKNPEYGDSSSRVSDKYNKIALESMGGPTDNELDKEAIIIQNISKCITIDKYVD